MVAHTIILALGEAEAGRHMLVLGQPGLYREQFQDSQGCVGRPCLKTKQKKFVIMYCHKDKILIILTKKLICDNVLP